MKYTMAGYLSFMCIILSSCTYLLSASLPSLKEYYYNGPFPISGPPAGYTKATHITSVGGGAVWEMYSCSTKLMVRIYI